MVGSQRILEGRNAVITGAGRGIGRAIALEFAQEGARLFLLARSEDELQQTCDLVGANGGTADYLVCDVSDILAVNRTFDKISAKMPWIDVLVNNAGVQVPIGPFTQNDLGEWRRTVEVNLFGTIYCSRAVLPGMEERGYGKIINLSGGGSTSPRPNFSAYAVSKTAIVRYTETLAEEMKNDHIDINAVAPGAINTRMLEDVLAAKESAGPEYKEAVRRKETGGQDAQNAARLICFLASALSDGITGKLISAVWDPWQDGDFQKLLKTDKDVATLRRIDNKYFFKKQ